MKVYMMLADGFEETEAIAPWDILLRAGADIKTVSIKDIKNVSGAHGMEIKADLILEEADTEELDMIILPGGTTGMENLKNDNRVCGLLKEMNEKNKLIAAICASPSILAGLGILDGKEATAFPSFRKFLINSKISDSKVIRDGNVITAAAAGVSMDFGFALAEALFGNDRSEEIKKQMLY